MKIIHVVWQINPLDPPPFNQTPRYYGSFATLDELRDQLTIDFTGFSDVPTLGPYNKIAVTKPDGGDAALYWRWQDTDDAP